LNLEKMEREIEEKWSRLENIFDSATAGGTIKPCFLKRMNLEGDSEGDDGV